VVCKQLGYSGAINFTIGSYFGVVPSLFAFDNVKCIGNETDLNDCPHLNDDDCSLEEGAGVICGTENGSYPSTTNQAWIDYTGLVKMFSVE
jgi:Scavenger receptor cysteine-rich domain